MYREGGISAVWLEKFQNYCFKAVHTYTDEKFEGYLGENGVKIEGEGFLEGTCKIGMFVV